MEAKIRNHRNTLSDKQDDIDIKKIILSYLKHWKWFVLSCLIFSTLAFFYLRYETPQFNAYAKIMLMDDDGVSNPADLLLKDLGQLSNSENKKIEDEIEILKSRSLMKGVVKRLDLNRQFFVKGRFHDTQYFPNNNSPVDITFIESDSVVYKSNFSFNVYITSPTTFDFIYTPKSQDEEVSKKYVFGKNFPTPIGDIILTPNTKKIDNFIGQTIYIRIKSLEALAEHYKSRVKISQASELSKVLNLSLNDASPNKAKAILNTLVDEYNRTSIEAKNEKSNNTADFINKRIDLIATDLSEVDNKIQQFKTGNKLTNVTSEADLYLNASTRTEQSLATSKTEYSMVNFMKNQINDDVLTRIPSNVGLADGSINSMASKYNELLDKRDKLLKSSSEKNPIIVTLDQQLNNLKNSLKQSLDNSAKSIGLQIKSLENQSAKISQKIYAVPGQVRESRDIQREQGIKESLYLYLLQKREEATISLISTSPNAKIIDEAHTNYFPVSPNRKITFMASLIVGLGIPFGIIFILQLLDNRIHNKEDLEKIIKNIMVLGEVPRIDKGDKALIEHNDRSILSESFRIIRTNFDFIKRSKNEHKYNNIVFVTSTINGEGKSFFSLNMALTLANTGKRVLLIGADVRNPQIYSAIKKEKAKNEKLGLTEYLADKSVKIVDTINNYVINDIDIDILLSGKVPPNPAELLMSDRIEDLFNKVSEEYDYVIVDTAPSMLVTDTLLISQYAGHTIYLTRADHTEKKILNFAKELHAEDKLNNMMLVVNDVKQSNFGYGAKYGYYGTPEKKGFFGRFKKA
ncbi:polysaccharide biosynthesis tyrosine autokinase [uncultured Algibacter sp.]|uniref:GumC family protein n=1 Tax=uncultured Algibacter sp. TaxID=298659 RepID=UPI002618087E|nr:polysaccharide biosynthesis tyrosine autokinase [uncultured Algibacter sp.]